MVLYWLKDALTPTSIEDERVNTRNKIILVIIESAVHKCLWSSEKPIAVEIKIIKREMCNGAILNAINLCCI